MKPGAPSPLRPVYRAAVLAATLAHAPAAGAYTRSESQWNPALLPVPYRVNAQTAPASLGRDAALAAVRGGFGAWDEPVCTTWRSRNAGPTARTRAEAGDGENSVLWVSRDWPAEYGEDTVGVTTTLRMRGGYTLDADISFNAQHFTWNTTGVGGVDAQSVAAHEAGHFLGLGHSAVRAAVMYAYYEGGARRALSSDDVAGVCAIYPSGEPVPDAGADGGRDAATGVGDVGDACRPETGCAPGNRCVCRVATDCYCTRPCSLTAPCPLGYLCQETSLGRLCVPLGGATTLMGNLGDPCTRAADCVSGVCVRSDGGTPFCSQVCADDCTCPDGFTCVASESGTTQVCARGANRCGEAPPDAGGGDGATGPADAGFDGGGAPDAGGDAAPDEGHGETPRPRPGCACRAGGASQGAGGAGGGALLAAAAAAARAARRRRRSRR